MIHLSSKTKLIKGKKVTLFYVATLAKNRKELNSSESNGLTTFQSALKNIRASAIEHGNTGNIRVQDNTGKKPVIILVHRKTGYTITDQRVNSKPYIIK